MAKLRAEDYKAGYFAACSSDSLRLVNLVSYLDMSGAWYGGVEYVRLAGRADGFGIRSMSLAVCV